MKKTIVSEPVEQVIESTHENSNIRMKVKVTNGKLVSISFFRIDTGKHIFSLRQLDNGGLQRASEFLWDVMQVLREARSIIKDFRRMSKD